MADRAALSMIGGILGTVTALVIAITGIVVTVNISQAPAATQIETPASAR